jgi:hypothetical protein
MVEKMNEPHVFNVIIKNVYPQFINEFSLSGGTGIRSYLYYPQLPTSINKTHNE